MSDADKRWCRAFADAMGVSRSEVEANLAKAEAAGPDGFRALIREHGILIEVGADEPLN